METPTNITRANRKNPLSKILVITLLVLSMLAGATATAMADPGSDGDGPIILDGQLEQEQQEDTDPQPQVGGSTPSELRRYVVAYTWFHARDETRRDWLGSDEMSFELSVAATYRGPWVEAEHQTQEYGDVDTGETHYLSAEDRCLIVGGCLAESPGVPSYIILSARAIEHDRWERRSYSDRAVEVLHPEDLEAAMPFVGQGMTVQLPMTFLSGGEYVIQASIRRVADAAPTVDNEWVGATTTVDEIVAGIVTSSSAITSGATATHGHAAEPTSVDDTPDSPVAMNRQLADAEPRIDASGSLETALVFDEADALFGG